MSRKRDGREEPTDSGRKGSGGIRVPSWAMLPVGLMVGYLVGNWPGAVFGGVMGLFLWRSRA